MSAPRFGVGDVVARREVLDGREAMCGTVVKVSRVGKPRHSGGGTHHVRVRWENGHVGTLADTQLTRIAVKE